MTEQMIDLWSEFADRIWLNTEGLLCIDSTVRDLFRYEGIDDQRLKACIEDNILDDTDKGGELWINWEQVRKDYEEETGDETSKKIGPTDYSRDEEG